MEPNTFDLCILQYVSIIASFRHSVVSQGIDRLHADISQHVEAEGAVVVGAATPADDPRLDAHEPRFEVRKEVLLATELERDELVVEPEGVAFVVVLPL